MKKIAEHTYGATAFMRIELNDGATEEITVFWSNGGESYRTTADGDPARRAEIIAAFNKLY